MPATPENFPLLAELLADQQRLATPVARFSAVHDAAPALEPVYRDLIPLSAPGPGEQYAFEVELDTCTGCKACVSACHSLNGLDDTETWRDVGLVVGGDWRDSFQQTVTSACHHCADPACLNGCPVLAYEKDPVTGIVRHLDDQCIGCQYCILKCPYDVPKYNARLGIVRKCDMCHGRLAEGEAPACVQACPTHAIRIVTVAVGGALDADEACESGRKTPSTEFLSVAPDPGYTQPTTRYVSRRDQPPDLHAADAATLRPQPPHWPLVVALTLLPLAVGSHLVAAALTLFSPDSVAHALGGSVTYYVTLPEWLRAYAGEVSVTHCVTLFGWGAGVWGLGASALHLGRPGRAWRVFLGWRRSWLSREAMAFGAWGVAATVALKVPAVAPWAAALGVAGLICSVMIYVDTRRRAWRLAQTAPRFFGAMLALGAAAALAFGVAPGASAGVIGFVLIAKVVCDAQLMRCLDAADSEDLPTPELQTARLLAGPLRRVCGLRIVATLATGVLLLAVVAGGALPVVGGGLVLAGVATNELFERYLFFRAVDSPKMPGLPAGAGGKRTA